MIKKFNKKEKIALLIIIIVILLILCLIYLKNKKAIEVIDNNIEIQEVENDNKILDEELNYIDSELDEME